MGIKLLNFSLTEEKSYFDIAIYSSTLEILDQSSNSFRLLKKSFLND